MLINKKKLSTYTGILALSLSMVLLSGCHDSYSSGPNPNPTSELTVQAVNGTVLKTSLNGTAESQFTVSYQSDSATPATLSFSGLSAPFSLVNTDSSDDCLTSGSLAPGSSCTLTVRYQPTSASDFFQQQTLTASAGSASGSISLSGLPVFLQTVESDLWEKGFPNAQIPGTITYENVSADPISINFDTNAFPSEIGNIQNNCTATLPPSQSCTITYTFTGNANATGQGYAGNILKDVNIPVTINVTGYGELNENINDFTTTTYGKMVFVKTPQGFGAFKELPGSNISKIINVNGILYAGTRAGLGISQDGGATWKTYGVGDGLLGGTVNNIIVANNMLYITTSNGLAIANNIIDPASFTSYTSNSNPALPSNYINSLAVSADHIYVGTDDNGLAVSDNATTPTSFTTYSTSSSPALPSDYITSLAVMADHIYVGTYNGLAVSDNATTPTSFTTYSTSSSPALPSDYISSLAVTADHLYVGTDSGLAVSDNATAPTSFTIYSSSSSPALPSDFINSLAVTADHLYVGTDNGLAIGNNATAPTSFTIYSTSSNPALPSDSIQSLAVTADHLYVGTYNGLAESDNATAPTSFITYSTSTSTNSLNNSISTLAVNSNYLYVGTSNSGLAVSNNPITPISYTSYSTTSTPALPSNTVKSLALTADNLYVGTDSGLSIGNNATAPSSFTTYSTTSTPALPGDFILKIAVMGTNLYVGTGSGLAIGNNATTPTSFTPYSTTSTPALPSNTVADVAVNSSNIYLAFPERAGFNGALTIGDSATAPTTFTDYPIGSISRVNVTATNLYTGSDSGSFSLRIYNNIITPSNPTIYNLGSSILSLLITANNLYAGTEFNGLVIGNSATPPIIFTTYSPVVAPYLPTETVQAIAVAGNYLYVATSSGVVIAHM